MDIDADINVDVDVEIATDIDLEIPGQCRTHYRATRKLGVQAARLAVLSPETTIKDKKEKEKRRETEKKKKKKRTGTSGLHGQLSCRLSASLILSRSPSRTCEWRQPSSLECVLLQ